MRRIARWGLSVGVAALASLGPVAVSQAAPAPDVAPRAGIPQGAWSGTSTNMAGDFSYGAVSFTVGRGVITKFRIDGVTVSGCGGFKSIIVPKLTISGRSTSGRHVPIPGVDDVIIIKARFTKGMIKGTFTEGPLCSGEGRFIARPR